MKIRLAGEVRRTAATAALLLGGVLPAIAAPLYSGVTTFGDSLSDTGNVLSLTKAFAPPPFPNFPGAPGRFSNGPSWIEYVTAGLGFPDHAAPANLLFTGAAVIPIGAPGGRNYAYGGARTGLGGSAGATTGLLGEWINWNGGTTPSRAADPDALYVFLAGGNDLRDFRSGVAGAASPVAAATNLVNVMGLMAQAGARHFLVGNLPDLGASPEAAALGLTGVSTALTLAFNGALDAGLGLLDAGFMASTGVDLDIVEVDLFALLQDVIADATSITDPGERYGITQISAPCMTPVAPRAYYFPGASDANCGAALFSDDLHPSAIGHRLIGEAALAALAEANAVSEPSALALAALACIAACAAGRRRRPVA